MSEQTSSSLHETVVTLLAARGLPPLIGREESLFISGRLDSLAATELLMMLESQYGIDLADADFDIAALDTLADMERMLGGRGPRRA